MLMANLVMIALAENIGHAASRNYHISEIAYSANRIQRFNSGRSQAIYVASTHETKIEHDVHFLGIDPEFFENICDSAPQHSTICQIIRRQA